MEPRPPAYRAAVARVCLALTPVLAFAPPASIGRSNSAAADGLAPAHGRAPQTLQEARPTSASWTPVPASERAARRALQEGLSWLAREQAEGIDGAFPRGDADEWAPVGVTALATLAFLAGGSSPGRGPYGAQVSRGVEFLVEHADLSPSAEHPGYISHGGDAISRTHGHGFATLALAQAYGMSPDGQRLKETLRAAVDLIQRSQGAEGGWEYEAEISANHEGSVTICYVQALRAARNSGFEVDGAVIARAEGYVQRLQKDDGTFRYQLDSETSSVALTAAGIATLNMAGTYEGGIIRSGIDAIWKGLALREEDGGRASFPHYERLYVTQAFWQLSDQANFERWFERERDRLIRRQRPDGSWPNPRFGSAYATAMNCLVLAIPDGVLPIFQR